MPSLIGRCGGGAGSVTVQQGVYNAPFQSIAGLGGGGDASWTYQSGDAVLDLSTPGAPAAVAKGLYIFSVTLSIAGGGIAGRSFRAALLISTVFARQQVTDIINPVGGFGVIGQVTDAVEMLAGQTAILRWTNQDNTAHNMSISEADVVYIPTA